MEMVHLGVVLGGAPPNKKKTNGGSSFWLPFKTTKKRGTFRKETLLWVCFCLGEIPFGGWF